MTATEDAVKELEQRIETAALQAIATAQQTGTKVVYIDCKHTFDTLQANSIGVDTEKLFLFQPDTAEQALKAAMYHAASQAIGLIVIDSIEGLESGGQLLSLVLPELTNLAHLTSTALVLAHHDQSQAPLVQSLVSRSEAGQAKSGVHPPLSVPPTEKWVIKKPPSSTKVNVEKTGRTTFQEVQERVLSSRKSPICPQTISAEDLALLGYGYGKDRVKSVRVNDVYTLHAWWKNNKGCAARNCTIALCSSPVRAEHFKDQENIVSCVETGSFGGWVNISRKCQEVLGLNRIKPPRKPRTPKAKNGNTK